MDWSVGTRVSGRQSGEASLWTWCRGGCGHITRTCGGGGRGRCRIVGDVWLGVEVDAAPVELQLVAEQTDAQWTEAEQLERRRSLDLLVVLRIIDVIRSSTLRPAAPRSGRLLKEMLVAGEAFQTSSPEAFSPQSTVDVRTTHRHGGNRCIDLRVWTKLSHCPARRTPTPIFY